MKNKIKKERLIAMKNKENIKKNVLGVLLGELDRVDKDPTKEQIIKTIKKIIDANIEVGSEITLKENEILQKYMPQLLSNSELEIIINTQISYNEYKGIKDMGKIMGFLSSNYIGQYDGKKASEIIRIKLN